MVKIWEFYDLLDFIGSKLTLTLNFVGLPYIRILPKVTAVAGEQLKLKCPVAGYPIEEIHWERSGSELPNGLRQKVSHLRFFYSELRHFCFQI